MSLKINYAMFWDQLGLKNPHRFGSEDYARTLKCHNLVARYLFDFPGDYLKWQEEEKAWKDYLSKAASEQRDVECPSTDYGYYSILKKAADHYGEDYTTL